MSRPGVGDAGRLLRQARPAAGLTQDAVAVRAGIGQSIVSAYENGRREPSLPTLARLIEAADHVLVVELRPDVQKGLPGTPRGRRLARQRSALREVAERHRGRNLRLVGSVARGEDRPDSDIDLLVDLPSDVSLLDLLALRRELAELVDAPVDLMPSQSLRPAVAESMARDAVLL